MKIQIRLLLSPILLWLILFHSNGLCDTRVHRGGNVRMNIADYGYIGNLGQGREGAMGDPENDDEWAPQCEFPAESGSQYLYQGGLWIGALVLMENQEVPRVSVALDGWIRGIRELYADFDSEIIERSNIRGATDYLDRETYSPDAVATQEFLSEFADTLTDPDYVSEDPVDGEHMPLGISVKQKSLVWDDRELVDFIIIEWEVENISDQHLKNLYLGLFIDGDVGATDERNGYTDDLSGLAKWRYFENQDGEIDSVRINLSYIADNDGRPLVVNQGNDFTAPGVSGIMMLDSPNPELETSFNWWVSNGDASLDYGPNWQDDGAHDYWTDDYGTPMGDVRKYFLMSNRELDYDMVYSNDPDYIREHPQEFRDRWDEERIIESHDWRNPRDDERTPEDLIERVCTGSDAKFLQSWGPLGVFDHIDENGMRIYRLNPGESFTLTVAYVCAEGFHDPNLPQGNREGTIDPNKFDFTDLWRNAATAQAAFDEYLSVDNSPIPLLPEFIMLSPNYPNPFNSSTIVIYSATNEGIVSLSIIDNMGRVARSWEEQVNKPGVFSFAIDGSGLTAGNYYLQAIQNGSRNYAKLILLR